LKSVRFRDICMHGDLAMRAGLNYARLEGTWYRPEEVFKADSHGWPGDWEGRVILALTLLSQSTHRPSAYLNEIMEKVPEHLNAKGYFGPILPEGVFDEQHFGGHSWMLRALSEYVRLTESDKALEMLKIMVTNFLLPARGAFSRYPIAPGLRFSEPGPWLLSKLQTKTKHHAETSDAGCAFIMIDGATAAYELLRWDSLRRLVEEMIARFMEMDLQALNIQTHATLSATRGMIRFYELTGETKYLDMARSRYALYRGNAWTEGYGNYNWFGAPRWTEPCAIIDSFMAATLLWKHTGDAGYLADAHLIYFNALSHGHRVNGSFGTDRCLGAEQAEENLFLSPINYETYWCCTMRGGEGFSRAIEYSFFTEGNSVFMPFFHNCETVLALQDGMLELTERTGYPYRGDVRLVIQRAAPGLYATINLFVPPWADDSRIALNGVPLSIKPESGFITVSGNFSAGDEITLDMDMSVRVEDTMRHNQKGRHKFLYGPMLLGVKVKTQLDSVDGNRFENYAEGKYKSAGTVFIPKDAVISRKGDWEFTVRGTDTVLNTLCSVRDMTCEDTMRQVLFEDGQEEAQ
jgi:uncharacterized protein